MSAEEPKGERPKGGADAMVGDILDPDDFLKDAEVYKLFLQCQIEKKGVFRELCTSG